MRADFPFDELKTRFAQLGPLLEVPIVPELEKLSLIAPLDPEMAAVRGRRIVDTIMRTLYSKCLGDPGARSLEHLISELERGGVLPREIAAHAKSLKGIANLCAHEVFAVARESLDEGSLVVCLIDLAVILKWYARYVEQGVAEPNFTGVDGLQISRDFVEAETLCAIDKAIYGDVPEQDQATPGLARSWFLKNPMIYTLLFAGKRVVGYCNAMPLEDEAYNLCLSGQLRDGLITPDMIRTYELPGLYKLYVVSIAILPEYRRYHLAFRTLYDEVFRKLFVLGRQEVFVSEVVANAWTSDGRSLCRSFGMTPLCPHIAQGEMHRCILIPPSVKNPASKLRLLLEAYRELGAY